MPYGGNNDEVFPSIYEKTGQDCRLADSGNRTEFLTGAVRDMAGDKGRCDLLPASALLRMFSCHEDFSFDVQKQSVDVLLEVVYKSILDYLCGDADHDYLAIAARLLFIIMEKESSTDLFINNNIENIYPNATIRFSKHYEHGAKKYSERNWEKGINISSFIDSGIRHLLKYTAHHTDEDHLVAAAWNIVGAMWTEQHHPELQDIPSRKHFSSENKEEEVVKNCETCKYEEVTIWEDPCRTCCYIVNKHYYYWTPKEDSIY